MRKRFNAAEKEIIANAFHDHAGYVEWRNVTTWGYTAQVKPKILTDEFGGQYVEAINRSSSPTVFRGDDIRIYPTYIREFDNSKQYR